MGRGGEKEREGEIEKASEEEKLEGPREAALKQASLGLL